MSESWTFNPLSHCATLLFFLVKSLKSITIGKQGAVPVLKLKDERYGRYRLALIQMFAQSQNNIRNATGMLSTAALQKKKC